MAWDGGRRRREASGLEPGGPGSEAASAGPSARRREPPLVGPPPPAHKKVPSSAYPVAFHICLKAVHVLVRQAPGYHNLRAIIEVLVTVLGEVQDGILRVLYLHACQQWVGHLLIEALEFRWGGTLIISGHQGGQGEDRVGPFPLVPLQVVGSLKLGQSSS